jgi:beta-phosphoglucomutase
MVFTNNHEMPWNRPFRFRPPLPPGFKEGIRLCWRASRRHGDGRVPQIQKKKRIDMLDAVLFDMDGVLIDSEPIHRNMYLNMARELDCQGMEHILSAFVGRSSLALWEHTVAAHGLTGDPQAFSDMQMSRYRDFLRQNKGKIEPSPGIPELLADLVENGVRIAVASSNTRKNVDFVLRYFGMVDIFDATVSGDDGAPAKPAPDIFLLAAQRIGAAPARCVVIEDAQNGVAAAKAAGMRCAALANPNSGNQDLTKADLVVQSARELRFSLLEDLAAGRSGAKGR